MTKEAFVFYGERGTALHAIVWQPDGDAKAILQVTHGMTEHMDRYEAFAETMTRNGIIVAGFDLRGHGHNPGDRDCASMGETGWNDSLQDMYLFFLHLDALFPDLPHYMLGFSLGSFLLREYLGKYPQGIAGAVIAGSGQQPALLLSIIMGVVKGQIKKAGFDNTTDLVRQLSFSVYNDKFKPNRTEADWLCSDNAQLDTYLADPLCRKTISSGLFYQLLDSMKRTAAPASYASWNKELPVLLLSGDRDPVGDLGKGLPKIDAAMEKAGMKLVTGYMLADARHDLFHEEENGNARSVENLILEWMTL